MVGDDRPLIFALCIVFPVIAIAAVVARIRARKVKGIDLAGDDWTIIVSLFFSIGLSIDVLICSRIGNLGGHETFTPQGLPVFNNSFLIFGQTLYALEILAWPALGLTKISVLLLYARIFVNRNFRILCWVTVGLVTAWTITFTFALIFSCVPIESHWNPTLHKRCVDQVVLFTVALATDIGTDALILSYPVWNVYKLQMRWKRKLAVIGIFLLGGLVTVMGGIRLHYLIAGYAALTKPTFDDISYAFGPPFYWSVIECNVGILSACLPTLRPLLDDAQLIHTFSKLRSVLTLTRSTRSSKASSENVRMDSLEVESTHHEMLDNAKGTSAQRRAKYGVVTQISGA